MIALVSGRPTAHITSLPDCINPLPKASARTAPTKNEKGRLGGAQRITNALISNLKDCTPKA